jgi:hypothetical protein
MNINLALEIGGAVILLCMVVLTSTLMLSPGSLAQDDGRNFLLHNRQRSVVAVFCTIIIFAILIGACCLLAIS